MLPALIPAAGGLSELLAVAGPLIKPLLLYLGITEGMDVGKNLLAAEFPSLNPEYRMLERQLTAQKAMEDRKSEAVEKMSKREADMFMAKRALEKRDAADMMKVQNKLAEGEVASQAGAAIAGSPAALRGTVSFSDILGIGR